MEAPRKTQTTRTVYEGGTIDQAAWDEMCNHMPPVIDPFDGGPFDKVPVPALMRGVDFRDVTFRASEIRLVGCDLEGCTFEPGPDGSMDIRLLQCTGGIQAHGRIGTLDTVSSRLDMDLSHADIDALTIDDTSCQLDMYEAQARRIFIDQSIVDSEFLGLVTPDVDYQAPSIIRDSFVRDELADGLPGLRVSGGEWHVRGLTPDSDDPAPLPGPTWVDCTPYQEQREYALPTDTPWPVPEQPDTDATPTPPATDADTEPWPGINTPDTTTPGIGI